MATTSDQKPLHAPTPWWWRLSIAACVLAVGLSAYLLQNEIGTRLQSALGVLCLLGIAACFSLNLRAVSWRAIILGLILQFVLAAFILKFEIRGLGQLGIPDGFRPGYEFFEFLAAVVKKFIEFTNDGSKFVFGNLSNPVEMEKVLGKNNGFIVAFAALPPIIFISCFFSILYYFGILQFIVRLMARIMMYLLGTSGAETLSAAANIFMGQTEAPLIIKPYISRMTQSELLAMMVGGMATISGSLMAVYVGLGADRVAILATSVMAAPCGLYLSKLVMPELETPATRGFITTADEQMHVNAIDAAATGASDGLKLALNVAAMLIAFLGLLAMANFLLAQMITGQSLWQTWNEGNIWWKLVNVVMIGVGFAICCLMVNLILKMIGVDRQFHQLFGTEKPGQIISNLALLLVALVGFVLLLDWALPQLPEHLQLKNIFGSIFSPFAFLMGIQGEDIYRIADLLGTKLAANEFLAFADLRKPYFESLTPRSRILATYALTGFANFGSVGIQIGGIGALAPDRRSDLARLGLPALLVGFWVTIINAAIAGVFL